MSDRIWIVGRGPAADGRPAIAMRIAGPLEVPDRSKQTMGSLGLAFVRYFPNTEGMWAFDREPNASAIVAVLQKGGTIVDMEGCFAFLPVLPSTGGPMEALLRRMKR